MSALFLVRHFAANTIETITGEDSAPTLKAAVSHSLPSNLTSYTAILEKNPFGTSPAGPLRELGGGSGGESNVPASAGGLSLAGTVAGEGRNSFAIFQDKSGSQSFYRIGETVPDYGELERVEPEFVILDTTSGKVRLDITDLAGVNGNVSPAARVSDRPGAIGKPRPEDVGFIRQTGSGRYDLDKEGVQNSLRNPQRVLTDARMLPNIVNGNQQGFRVSEVIPGGVYDKLGLRNGDILLRINDLELNSPDSGVQAFSTLKGMDRITLYIIRGDRKMTHTYNIQ